MPRWDPAGQSLLPATKRRNHMRRLQKFGSILLVLALCLTMLPVTAGAEEPEAAGGWGSRGDTGWGCAARR